MTITANKAITDVCDEVHRQQTDEGHTEAVDDLLTNDELPRAAAVYALHDWKLPSFSASDPGQTFGRSRFAKLWWPWFETDRKPKSRRENMVRAAAMLIAEIQRIDRAEA